MDVFPALSCVSLCWGIYMAEQVIILYNGMLNIGSDISYKFIKHMGHSKKISKLARNNYFMC